MSGDAGPRIWQDLGGSRPCASGQDCTAMRTRNDPDPARRGALPRVLLLAFALGLSACRVVQGVADAPGQLVGAATGEKKKPPAIDLEKVRQENTQLADRAVARVDAGALLFVGECDTQEAKEQALQWRIHAAERVYACATVPLPVAALGDLVALAAYEARVHESYWSQQWGPADRQIAAAWRALEQDGLETAARCLPEADAAALKEALAAWEEAAQDAVALAQAGPPRITELVQVKAEEGGRAGLLGSLGLDPLDSIEPATREVARARELAERGLFLAQRSPRLLALRLELLTLHLTAQPDVQGVLQSVERTSQAADSVAATAKELPERLRTEGDALLQRTSAELAAQREALVGDLERTSGPTRELLAQAQQTIDSATKLAQALDTTTRTVDTFLAHVNPPEPEGAAPKPAEAAGPPGKPFDPVEYTALAAQVTAGLEQLNTTAATLDHALPAVRQAADDAAARVDASVERAYGLAVRIVLIAAAAAAALLVLARALRGRASPPAGGGAAR